jgi:hypothetical protein
VKVRAERSGKCRIHAELGCALEGRPCRSAKAPHALDLGFARRAPFQVRHDGLCGVDTQLLTQKRVRELSNL